MYKELRGYHSHIIRIKKLKKLKINILGPKGKLIAFIISEDNAVIKLEKSALNGYN